MAAPTRRGRFAAILLAIPIACHGGSTPPPGYTGPYPSAAAQSALQALEGRALRGTRLGPKDGELLVESFAVVPNPVTGKGPVVTLVLSAARGTPHDPSAKQGSGGRFALPVLTDGDAADLVQRVTGTKPDGFGGETSPLYRATIGIE